MTEQSTHPPVVSLLILPWKETTEYGFRALVLEVGELEVAKIVIDGTVIRRAVVDDEPVPVDATQAGLEATVRYVETYFAQKHGVSTGDVDGVARELASAIVACVPDSGGHFPDAPSREQFEGALRAVFGRALNHMVSVLDVGPSFGLRMLLFRTRRLSYPLQRSTGKQNSTPIPDDDANEWGESPEDKADIKRRVGAATAALQAWFDRNAQPCDVDDRDRLLIRDLVIEHGRRFSFDPAQFVRDNYDQ